MGTDYWKELIEFMNKMAQRPMTADSELSLIYATDSVEEAIAHIRSKRSSRLGSNASCACGAHFPGSANAAVPRRHGLLGNRVGLASAAADTLQVIY